MQIKASVYFSYTPGIILYHFSFWGVWKPSLKALFRTLCLEDDGLCWRRTCIVRKWNEIDMVCHFLSKFSRWSWVLGLMYLLCSYDLIKFMFPPALSEIIGGTICCPGVLLHRWWPGWIGGCCEEAALQPFLSLGYLRPNRFFLSRAIDQGWLPLASIWKFRSDYDMRG